MHLQYHCIYATKIVLFMNVLRSVFNAFTPEQGKDTQRAN